MTTILEGPVCGVDGCTGVEISEPSDVGAKGRSTLQIDVISDAICPWCWVGKHRLDDAIAALAPEITATITWKPFELNPGMPKGGLDRRSYRSRKFGSWERSQALDAQVADAAKADGLEFRHERIERTPNTLDAHRLIRLAGLEGRQDAVVEALFSAYFHDGRDVGDAGVLLKVATAAGLDSDRVSAMFASDEGLAEVQAEIDHAAQLGVSGVPTVVVNGKPLFSGALRPQLIEAHLRAAAATHV